MTEPNDRDALLASGLLLSGGVDGVYHRSNAFEQIVRALEAYVSAAGAGEFGGQLYFAPVQDRTTIERSGYVSSFPNLIGAVTAIPEDSASRAVRDPSSWTELLAPTELSLSSAVCHGLYPLLAGKVLDSPSNLFELHGWVFRREPSADPARMQTFRQLEFVFVGSADGAIAHRDGWLARGRDLLADLGLDVDTQVANDPFFGRASSMLAEIQLEKELKFEVLAPISSDVPGAIASANYHETHFGEAFDISLSNSVPAHSACFAFGLERTALALLRRHGHAIDQWPEAVRRRLFAHALPDA